MRLPRITLLVLILLLTLYAQAVGSTEILEQRQLERVASWQSKLAGLEYTPNEIIVEFGDARSLCYLDASVLEGLRISKAFEYRPAAVFRIENGETVAEVLARLEGKTGIVSAGPNLIRHCAFAPNDPRYNLQGYMLPIHSDAAWDVTTGSSSVDVAVIDTGLDVDHPEFAGRVVWKQNFFDPGEQGSDNVFDDSGHGTAVAGIIAARGNNNVGIAGMAWDVRIMAFRACGGPDLQCSIVDEVMAIDSAVAHGADVINLSLGGKGTNSIETAAVKAAYDAGVVMVAASGNGNPGQLYVATGDPAQDQANLYYPAAFPEVIGVAGLDNSNGTVTDPAGLVRATFSNYGESIVSVAAVATGVESTVPFRPKTEVPYAIYLSRDYSRLSGTSFACPQVSGLACLVLSKYPQLSPLEVESLIESSAWSMGGPDANQNGVDDYLGHGLLDAGAALGNGPGEAVFENGDFLVGITASPLFADDILVVVRCKRGSDGPPSVSYFVHESAENAAVTMVPLAAHPNTFLGKFQTSGSGTMTIQISGVLSGLPLESMQVVYTLID